MTRRFALLLAAASLFVPAILLCDGPGASRQLTLALLTGAFLFVAASISAIDRTAILCAIIVATMGEIVLSVAWELYSYRFTTLIPLYVPLGHGLFYTLAAGSARQRWLREHADAISRAVLVGGSVIAAGSLVLLRDQWGLVWWVTAALIMTRSRSRLLLSICCSYTMLLEWAGTWIGNWRWTPTVPFIGLHSANPPSGVGILYVILDLVTVSVCAWLLRRKGRCALTARTKAHASLLSAPLHVNEVAGIGSEAVLAIETHRVARQ